jgi:hypothetical protein
VKERENEEEFVCSGISNYLISVFGSTIDYIPCVSKLYQQRM